MAAFALVFAALAALLHFYIFYLEVPAFGSAAFCRVFRIAPESCPMCRLLHGAAARYRCRKPKRKTGHGKRPNSKWAA